MMFRYLCTVRHKTDFSGGVDLDSWMPVPPEPSHLAASAALARMSGKEVISSQAGKEITDAIFAMEMRIRFNADFYPKILLIKAEDVELDRDMMENLLAAKLAGGELGEFLKSAEL